MNEAFLRDSERPRRGPPTDKTVADREPVVGNIHLPESKINSMESQNPADTSEKGQTDPGQEVVPREETEQVSREPTTTINKDDKTVVINIQNR
ncbi:hypothetical protein PAPYR_518 [Paratrimastix pyriformis]|uniref:Uncharacterized protein n=1 Tax=Paratrimastix pyriformis TaxID=342808 RepID=A0ABQ8UVQ3_9EUKA|nr:hypothetical protein PAPYR_518 [Paratrimastix pyriformis]